MQNRIRSNALQVRSRRILYRLDESLTGDDPLIARFCIPSKTADNYESSDGIHCIRKCCPLGSVVNKTTRNCQKHSSSTSFNDDLSHQLREYRTDRFAQIDDFEIVDGVPPHYHNNGKQAINLSQFYLLKDGRMHVIFLYMLCLPHRSSSNVYLTGAFRIFLVRVRELQTNTVSITSSTTNK